MGLRLYVNSDVVLNWFYWVVSQRFVRSNSIDVNN